MRTIIHDLNDKDVKKIKFRDSDKVISANNCKNNCVGCFSCWIKNPKRCIYNDDYSNMCNYIKDSKELIIISKNRYGCYSASVKKVLERCIGYVLPYFTIRNKEIHHESRYSDGIEFKVYFYGDCNNEYNKSLSDLVRANAINLNAESSVFRVVDNIKEINECIH